MKIYIRTGLCNEATTKGDTQLQLTKYLYEGLPVPICGKLMPDMTIAAEAATERQSLDSYSLATRGPSRSSHRLSIRSGESTDPVRCRLSSHLPSYSRPNSPSDREDASVRVTSSAPYDAETGSMLFTLSVVSPSMESAFPVIMGIEPTLKPISTSGIQRYSRGVFLSKRSPEEKVEIMPMTRSFDSEYCPPDWAPCMHPEGALYFIDQSKHFFTDANLYSSHEYAIIAACKEYLEKLLLKQDIKMEEGFEIVLELIPNADDYDSPMCGYYIADNKTRSLFWLEMYDAESMVIDFEGETSLPHMRHVFEARYWLHCEMYPNHREVPKDLLHELMGILMFNSTDSMTSSVSVSPYAHEELQKMMGLVKSIPDIGLCDGRSAWVVSRLMSIFAHGRFLHYHGLPGARLSREQTIYGDDHHKRSLIFKLFSIILFNSPKTHIVALEKMWVDKIINYQPWSQHLAKMLEEWEKLLLLSTVMLAVNVSFLSISSVDRGTDMCSVAQVASYLSSVSNLASIIIGLLLIKQHRKLAPDDAEVAQRYLYGKPGGLATLAVMYSLPFALLMWALLAFLTALFCISFKLNPIALSTSLQIRLPIGVMWTFLLGFLMWFLVVSVDWERDWNDKIGCLAGLRYLNLNLNLGRLRTRVREVGVSVWGCIGRGRAVTLRGESGEKAGRDDKEAQTQP